MARVIDNAKGFKVIEMSLPESVTAFGGVEEDADVESRNFEFAKRRLGL